MFERSLPKKYRYVKTAWDRDRLYYNKTLTGTITKGEKEVSSERYRKPFPHDIEYLTIDNEGYVYWRGKYVNHYDIAYVFLEKGREAALELARRCRHLEKREIEVNSKNVVLFIDYSKPRNARNPKDKNVP